MSRRIITGTVPTAHPDRGIDEDEAVTPSIPGAVTPRPTSGNEGPQAFAPPRTAAPAPVISPDDFLGRLVKYIPAELVGLYVAARGVIPKTAEPSVYWAVAGVTWLFVPVYFWFVTTRNKQKPLKTQILLATIAFPIWVFAIG